MRRLEEETRIVKNVFRQYPSSIQQHPPPSVEIHHDPSFFITIRHCQRYLLPSLVTVWQYRLRHRQTSSVMINQGPSTVRHCP